MENKMETTNYSINSGIYWGSTLGTAPHQEEQQDNRYNMVIYSP